MIKIAKNKKAILAIAQDTDPTSPRDWDNLGTMICFNSKYSLGDEHDICFQDGEDWADLEQRILKDLKEQFVIKTRCKECMNHKLDGTCSEYLKCVVGECKGQKTTDEIAVILPLFMYEHSGITINTKGHGSQVGWIYVTKEDIRKEWGIKRVTREHLEKTKKVLEAEVEAYDQYITGDIYGFILETPDGEHIDSCWGFYGSEVEENGMLDYIGQEHQDLISNLECVI